MFYFAFFTGEFRHVVKTTVPFCSLSTGYRISTVSTTSIHLKLTYKKYCDILLIVQYLYLLL
jgi:hypothetical protein